LVNTAQSRLSASAVEGRGEQGSLPLGGGWGGLVNE
jgi:hypothetical protein